MKAIRLADIRDIDAANAWLPGYVAEHNARFAIAPANPEDVHRRYAGTAAGLARIGALHHIRSLSKDLVVSLQRQRYIVQTQSAPRDALQGKKIKLVVYADRRVELVAGMEVLPYKVFDPIQSKRSTFPLMWSNSPGHSS